MAPRYQSTTNHSINWPDVEMQYDFIENVWSNQYLSDRKRYYRKEILDALNDQYLPRLSQTILKMGKKIIRAIYQMQGEIRANESVIEADLLEIVYRVAQINHINTSTLRVKEDIWSRLDLGTVDVTEFIHTLGNVLAEKDRDAHSKGSLRRFETDFRNMHGEKLGNRFEARKALATIHKLKYRQLVPEHMVDQIEPIIKENVQRQRSLADSLNIPIWDLSDPLPF